jgi:hypothetical protein
MLRSLILALAVAACGSSTDDRPETAAYISAAILAPQCGTASCHASGTASHGLVFDTVADSIPSLQSIVQPGDPSPVASELVDVITTTGRHVMPPDHPLPTVDIDLITRWIADGAEGLNP